SNREDVRRFFRAHLEKVVPDFLHFPKAQLLATFHRRITVLVEDERRIGEATVENYNKLWAVERSLVPLERLGWTTDEMGREIFSMRLLRAQVSAIAPHGVVTPHYDQPALRVYLDKHLNAVTDA